MSIRQAIGIDLGGTKINIGLVNSLGQIEDFNKFETPLSAQAILSSIVKAAQSYPAHLPVGLSSPGLINRAGEVIGCTPNLPDWLGINLNTYLSEQLNRPVSVVMDGRAAAWGEFKLNHPDSEHFILLTLGTGLGSGIVTQGQLMRSDYGFGIGFGHMIVDANGKMCNCGQQGCLEAYVSGKALESTYQELSQSIASGPEIFELARSGHNYAQQALDQFLHMLAIGITNILNALTPDCIVLGGGISEQGKEMILEPLRTKIKSIMKLPFNFPEIIQLATLGSQAGLVGSALIAMEEVQDV